MRIRKIDTENKRDLSQFVNFPFQLYKDCPQWVPPLLSEARLPLNRHKHPYYQHSAADFFVAESEGQTLGRIAALHNTRHNEHLNAKATFFNHFEVVEDIQAARLLFEAAFAWSRERGLEEIIGPRGFISSDSSGILVEGFEHRPALNVPYNLPYYEPFVLDSGFVQDYDSLSGYLSGGHVLPKRILDIAAKISQRRGFWVKTFETKAEMRAWVNRVVDVIDKSFSSNHEYFPLTEAEIRLMSESLITIAHPKLIKLVMKDDKVIGFVFAYHDISAALQKSRGRLWPVGWYYLLTEQRRTKWANINGLGMLPEYQGLGGNAVLYTEVYKTSKAFPFEHADIVMVGEDNFKSFSDMESIGVKWYKRHRAYRKML